MALLPVDFVTLTAFGAFTLATLTGLILVSFTSTVAVLTKSTTGAGVDFATLIGPRHGKKPRADGLPFAFNTSSIVYSQRDHSPLSALYQRKGVPSFSPRSTT